MTLPCPILLIFSLVALASSPFRLRFGLQVHDLRERVICLASEDNIPPAAEWTPTHADLNNRYDYQYITACSVHVLKAVRFKSHPPKAASKKKTNPIGLVFFLCKGYKKIFSAERLRDLNFSNCVILLFLTVYSLKDGTEITIEL